MATALRKLPPDQVLLGDAIQLMRMLPPASVHCVVADPPYNNQLRGELPRHDDRPVDGVDKVGDRFTDFAAYDAFTREWLSECRKLSQRWNDLGDRFRTTIYFALAQSCRT